MKTELCSRERYSMLPYIHESLLQSYRTMHLNMLHSKRSQHHASEPQYH